LSQLTHIVKIFRNTQILIETECLSQVADKRASFAGRLSKDLRFTGGWFPHAPPHLKRRRLSRALPTHDSEDLAAFYRQIDAFDGLERSVLLSQSANLDRRLR